MSRVTSKLQVTIPVAVAARYGIVPGDEVRFVPAGDVVRLEVDKGRPPLASRDRLELFDAATARQGRRDARARVESNGDRGWVRKDLYDRPRSR